MFIVSEKIENYASQHTKSEPLLLKNLITETYENMALPHMLCGRLEGRFLKLLVQISKSEKALEIGTFTGYSALSIAEALPNHGNLITCEVDEKAANIAKKYFTKSPHGSKIELKMGEALETINTIEDNSLDFVFVDADKSNYPNYFVSVIDKVKVGGIMVFDNTLWSGKVLSPEKNTDRAIHKTNELINNDDRVENVILTVRDGINIVRRVR